MIEIGVNNAEVRYYGDCMRKVTNNIAPGRGFVGYIRYVAGSSEGNHKPLE